MALLVLIRLSSKTLLSQQELSGLKKSTKMRKHLLAQQGYYPIIDSPPEMFVFFGESNSGGLVPNSSASSPELNFRNLQILNNSDFRFENLKIGTNNLIGHIGLEYAMHAAHGMELQLANKYDSNYFPDRDVFLVKAGAGGSKVEEWTVSGIYFTNLKNRVNRARDLIFKNNPEDIAFMLSIGINNRGVGTSNLDYKNGLRNMILNLKTLLGIANPNISIMKFQFVTNLDMSGYNAVIDDVANEFNLKTFDTTGLTTIQDGYHLDYLGMKAATDNFLNSL
jgi:hypothetical protein